MNNNIKEKVERGPMYDMSITQHGYSSTFRDYDIFVDVLVPDPPVSRNLVAKPHRYRFSHCVSVEITTALCAEIWHESWSDIFLSDAWLKADDPGGYVWAVCHIDAHPGPQYIDSSAEARQWSEKLQQPMHEALIKTNVQDIRLIFHDLTITDLTLEPVPTAIT